MNLGTVRINNRLELRLQSSQSNPVKTCTMRLDRVQAQWLGNYLLETAGVKLKSAGSPQSLTFPAVDINVESPAAPSPTQIVRASTGVRGKSRVVRI